MVCASRAPLAERSAVNRQVLGSIPSGGDPSVFAFFPQEFGPVCAEGWRGTRTPRTHGATAARRIPDPKVGGSNPSGFIPFCLFFFFFSRARASFLFFVSDLPETLPPELRWQSGRLLTDRSLVRSQVVAHYFSLPFCIVFLQLHPFESAHCFSCLRHFTKLVVTLQ